MKEYKDFFYQLIIVLFSFVSLFVFFLSRLSSGSEAFYMSIPVAYLISRLLLNDFKISKLFNKSDVLKGCILFALTIVIFFVLSRTMFGKISIREVFLSFYFLLAVNVILKGVHAYIQEISNILVRKINQKTAAVAVVAVFKIMILFLFIFPYIMACFSVHRPKIIDKLNPKDELSINYEDVKFESTDNLLLDGWHLRHVKSDKLVLIAHGLGANKSNFISVANMWYQLGYDVFIFDLRGHGLSQGHTVSFGAKESNDILSALKYLSTYYDFNKTKVIGYGVSFGASAMINAASRTDAFKLLIVDSSFAKIRNMAVKTLDRMIIIPGVLKKLIANIGLGFVKLELGFDVEQYDPALVILKLNNIPILFIHGKNDDLIPASESELLYELKAGKKEKYWIDVKGHYATLADPKYRDTLKRFITNN